MTRLYEKYRSTGADLPFGNQLPAHGVAMEGYFWRLTRPDTGDAVIALCGINRSADGPWATVGLAAHPGGFLRTAAHAEASADDNRLGARAGRVFAADDRRLQVDMGPDAQLDVSVRGHVLWPRGRFGGSSVFQTVPGLNQYWHPWLLGGTAHGTAVLDGRRVDLTGAQVYAEKNWGREGFPGAWWWGQAHGFEEHDACVAFAGGEVSAGPLRTEVTALVVRLPGGPTIRLGNPIVSPVRADVTDETWSLRGRSAVWSVAVDASSPLGAAHVLPVPLPAPRRNVPGAIEHLAGRLTVTVHRRGRLWWRGTSRTAALENGGVERARVEMRRRGHGPDATCAAPQNRPRGNRP